MTHFARIAITLTVAATLLLAAVGGAQAASGTASSTRTPAAATKGAAKDTPSAAERRAASSSFEREKLDQSAFDEGSDASAAKKSSSSGGTMLRTMFGLLVVLGAIYAVHYLLKKWGKSKLEGVTGRSDVIDVVATTTLAQGRALHLVRVGGELMLVGATDQSITSLGPVNPHGVGPAAIAPGGGAFDSMLNGAMSGDHLVLPAGGALALPAPQEPFIRRFIDNLRLSTAR